MDEDDERAIELSSIAAIYPELVTDPAKPFTATLDLPVAPEKPLKIYFQSSTQAGPPGLLTPPSSGTGDGKDVTRQPSSAPLTAALNVDVHQLSHLPPLKIEITLPDGYPLEKPPVVRIHSEPPWLPQKTLEQIQKQSAELWEECGRDQVVYTFIDHVQLEAERAFGLADNSDDKFELSGELKLILLDYDMRRRREQFENETFDCGICLEPKKGRICHRLLLCGHVFCVACLQDFYNNCITEGDVDNVKCLDPGCGKNMMTGLSPRSKRKVDQTLNPSELLQIPIEQELVQRYVRLKRKKRLEADKNTIYCPRQWCQGAAKSKRHPKSDDPLHEAEVSDDESDNEQQPSKKQERDPENIPMSERLAVCEDCNYAFCSVCKKGWHGELARCSPRRQAELNAEEQASMDYMKRFSTPCPTCNAPAQKAFGCNHMICFKCKTHFCYLCSSYLMPDNPYMHFNDLKSICYMRLWELEGGDGADAGMGFAGGAGIAPWEVPDPEEADSDDESDMDDEDFRDFGGDDVVAWDDDSDDEEPAPDQRRQDRPHIEIVNFAGNGANRRIELPGGAQRAPALPAAPNPPHGRRGNARQRGNARPQQARRDRAQGHPPQPPRNAAHPPEQPQNPPIQEVYQVVDGGPDFDDLDDAPEPDPVVAAPGQGNNADAGLQRFLRLALEDREDEWDSDEDDGPAEPPVGPRARNRRR